MMFPDGVFCLSTGGGSEEYFWLVDGRLRGPKRTRAEADEGFAADQAYWFPGGVRATFDMIGILP